MGNIILVLLFVFAIWYLFFYKKQKIDENSYMKKQKEVERISHIKTPTEKLADSLSAARSAIQEQAKIDRAELEKDLKEAKEKIKLATNLLRDLGVSSALINLVEEMQHWHAWSKNENYDFSKNLVEGLVYNSGETKRTGKGETIINCFTFKGNRYRLYLANIHSGYDGNDRYAEVVLESAEKDNFFVVFKADVAQDGDEDISSWFISNVTALNVGEWVHDIVSLDALFSVKKQKDTLELKLKYFDSKTKDLDN